jgi:hypothetical protein
MTVHPSRRQRPRTEGRQQVMLALTALATLALALIVAALESRPASAAVLRGLPRGMHWRYIWHAISDCGPMHGKPAIAVWRGSGDMQSALFCPNGTVWPS